MTESRPHDDDTLRDELRALKQRLSEIERSVRDRRVEDRALPAESFEILRCRVDGERVALWLGEVREVLPVAEMLPLPEAPPWICGLLDVGGRTIVVIDVSSRFRRTGRELRLSDLVVVCRAEPRDVGLVVSEVFDIRSVPHERLSPPADEVPHASYVRGTIRDEDGQLLLLSLTRLVEASDVPATTRASAKSSSEARS